MLDALAPLVGAGGRLVYSTCSSEPEENQQVLDAFRTAHPRFAFAPLPEWAAPFADGPLAATTPERDRADAFFAATLRVA